jgi:hypothetical protein
LTYTKDNLPLLNKPWKRFKKTAITSAVKIDGPFAVETSEGTLNCTDGFLAIDARGYPYPIATEEFHKIYVEVA